VALKDRAAILPVVICRTDHIVLILNRATFITSTYYNKELPSWVTDFNARRLPDKYLSHPWNTFVTNLNNIQKALMITILMKGSTKGENKTCFSS